MTICAGTPPRVMLSVFVWPAVSVYDILLAAESGEPPESSNIKVNVCVPGATLNGTVHASGEPLHSGFDVESDTGVCDVLSIEYASCDVDAEIY